MFGVVGPLGENLDFLVHLGFDVQADSVRALKRYLNEKNLIHGRVMATISKFSPQIFKTQFRCQVFWVVGSKYGNGASITNTVFNFSISLSFNVLLFLHL